MVDSVELILADVLVDLRGERAGGFEVWPKGFSTTTLAFLVRPASASPLMVIPKSDGGISK
jgi:hypothetical protein